MLQSSTIMSLKICITYLGTGGNAGWISLFITGVKAPFIEFEIGPSFLVNVRIIFPGILLLLFLYSFPFKESQIHDNETQDQNAQARIKKQAKTITRSVVIYVVSTPPLPSVTWITRIQIHNRGR